MERDSAFFVRVRFAGATAAGRRLRILGIDEVSRKKGHKYLTLLYDPERGELVWIGKDRTPATLRSFFDELRPRRSKHHTAVCMDTDVDGRYNDGWTTGRSRTFRS